MKIRPKSFRIKLWIYFVLFTALIFSLLWLLQTVFLQSFYNGMLIKNTRSAAEEIAGSTGSSDFTDRIDELTVSPYDPDKQPYDDKMVCAVIDAQESTACEKQPSASTLLRTNA